MMTRTLALLTLSLCSLGCSDAGGCVEVDGACFMDGAPPPAAVAGHLRAGWTISDEFSADEIAAIVAAGDAWTSATGGRAAPTFSVGTAAPGQWVISRAPGDPGYGGVTTATRDAVTLHPDAAPADGCAWLMAAHELGHTLGVSHGGDVMRAVHGRSCRTDALTAADVALFDELYP